MNTIGLPDDVRRLPLGGGGVTFVSACDYDALAEHRWFPRRRANLCYAVRRIKLKGKEVVIYMHRLIIAPPDGMHVDHIDCNGLNNTRANLRLATSSQNQANARKRRGTTSSIYRGVTRVERRWRASIKVNYRTIRLGSFDTEVEAALAWDAAALTHFGEYARLNFPLGQAA